MSQWTPVVGVEGPTWREIGNLRDITHQAPIAFRQASPASTWTIEHGQNGYPDLVLRLDDNPTEPVYTDITYPDPNTAVVEWPQPVSGWAHAR